MNALENQHNKGNYLNRIEPIQNTPFFMVIQENNVFITFSQYKMTESYPLGNITSEDLTQEKLTALKKKMMKIIEDDKWNIIMRMVGITHEKIAQLAVEHMKGLPPKTQE